MFDLSLEDLQYGIHNTISERKTGITPFYGFSKLVAPIFDFSTDTTSFAIEAYNFLGQSNQFGLYATQGLESLSYEVGLLKKLKIKYGIEDLDVNKFALEGIKEGAKKVWDAIVKAFKTLIQSISNFIKSIMNFIGSTFAKTQNKLFDQYTEAKRNKQWDGEAKITSILGNSSTYDNTLVNKLFTQVADVTKFVDEGLAAIERGEKGQGYNDSTLSPAEQAEDFKKNKRDRYITGNISKIWEGQNKDAYGKKQSPKEYVNAMIWNNVKGPGTGDGKVGPIAEKYIFMLEPKQLEEAKKGVKTGQTAIKACVKGAKVAEKLAKQNGTPQHPKSISNYRSSAAFATGVLFATFGTWLSVRSAVAKAVRAGLKEGKKKESD